MKAFAVEFKGKTKKCIVMTVTRADLCRSIREAFKLEEESRLIVKYYDSDTDSYIDVDDDEVVPDEAVKLLAKLVTGE